MRQYNPEFTNKSLILSLIVAHKRRGCSSFPVIYRLRLWCCSALRQRAPSTARRAAALELPT